MKRLLSLQNIILFITLLSCFLCYLPLLLNYKAKYDNNTKANYHWPSWQGIDSIDRVNYTAGIISTLLFYEILTDSNTSHLSYKILIPRYIITIFYILTSWLFYIFQSNSTMFAYSICSLYMRCIIILGTLLYQLENKFQMNSRYLYFFTILLLQASTISIVWCQFTEIGQISQLITLLFNFVSTFFIFICCTYYFYKINQKFSNDHLSTTETGEPTPEISPTLSLSIASTSTSTPTSGLSNHNKSNDKTNNNNNNNNNKKLDSKDLISSISIYKLWKNIQDDEDQVQLYSCLCIIVHIIGHLIVIIYFGDSDFDHKSSPEITLRNAVDIIILILVYQIPSKIAYNQRLLTEKNLQTKKSFVRYISHEIRTPLNTVSLGLELLQKKLQSQSKLSNSATSSPMNSFIIQSNDSSSSSIEMTQEIYDSCHIALDIVNDLLFYDKIEEGKLILYKQKLNGYDLISDTIRTFSLQALSKHINLKYHHDESNIQDDYPSFRYTTKTVIEVDESKLSQVLRNLVSNALKFTPHGGSVIVTSKFLTMQQIRENQEEDESIHSSPSFKTHLFSWITVLTHSIIDVAKSYVVSGSKISSSSSITPAYEGEYDIEVGTGIKSSLIKGILRVDVQDTGPGISKINQAKLFKSIVQFDTATLQGGKGSGLGLWISNAIMKHHNGKIGVKSSGIAGEGALFYIEIPAILVVTRIEQSLNAIITSQIHTRETDVSTHNRDVIQTIVDYEANQSCSHACIQSDDENDVISNVITPHNANDKFFDEITDMMLTNITSMKSFQRALIVDDSKLNRKMLAAAIDHFFDVIDQVENGELAVQIVKDMWSQKICYDVIFMDNLMPVMNGGQATQEIRQLGFSNPIIGVTGNIMENDVKNFLDMGATVVIGKPVTIEGLEKILFELKPQIREQNINNNSSHFDHHHHHNLNNI